MHLQVLVLYWVGMGRVVIERVWEGYETGKGRVESILYAHIYTHTHICLDISTPYSFFQFSITIPLPTAADLANFKWVQVFFPQPYLSVQFRSKVVTCSPI
uniref:Uncharacterized protein n=1 Tax=Opuntia streptacantha TaxID=393608 RepID=A0A7C9DQG1_OPUST